MKILKVAFIEILIVIFFLGLVEVAAHFYFFLKNGYAFEESFLYDNDAQLIYKINENYKGKHGSFYLGMREDFFEREKGDKVRIVCLGASTTFGHKQFENSKVWPYLLEQLMGDERYEVLNAGVPGYGSSNLAARLKKEILGLEPDILIVFTGWNLAGSLGSRYAWVPDNVYFKEQPVLKRVNNFLIDKSIAYLKLSSFIVNKIKEKNKGTIDIVYKDELPRVKEDLKEMISVCKNNGIAPVVIKYPSRDYSHKRYVDTVKVIEDTAIENDAHVIDCSFYFENISQEERGSYFTDIAHFSDKGNEKIAEIIYLSLKNGGYVN